MTASPPGAAHLCQIDFGNQFSTELIRAQTTNSINHLETKSISQTPEFVVLVSAHFHAFLKLTMCKMATRPFMHTNMASITTNYFGCHIGCQLLPGFQITFQGHMHATIGVCMERIFFFFWR